MERMSFDENVPAVPSETPPEVGPVVPMGTFTTKTYRVATKMDAPPEVPKARPRPKAKPKAKKARAKVKVKAKAKPKATGKRPAKKKPKARARKRTR